MGLGESNIYEYFKPNSIPNTYRPALDGRKEERKGGTEGGRSGRKEGRKEGKEERVCMHMYLVV